MRPKLSDEDRTAIRNYVTNLKNELERGGIGKDVLWKELARRLNGEAWATKNRPHPWTPTSVARVLSTNNGAGTKRAAKATAEVEVKAVKSTRTPKVKPSREHLTQAVNRKVLMRKIYKKLREGVKSWDDVAAYLAECGIPYRKKDGTLVPWTNKEVANYYCHNHEAYGYPSREKLMARSDRINRKKQKQEEKAERTQQQVDMLLDEADEAFTSKVPKKRAAKSPRCSECGMVKIHKLDCSQRAEGHLTIPMKTEPVKIEELVSPNFTARRVADTPPVVKTVDAVPPQFQSTVKRLEGGNVEISVVFKGSGGSDIAKLLMDLQNRIVAG